MRKITIKFVGTGYYDINQARVKIYNSNCKKVYDQCTYNGRCRVCLEDNSIYTIKASTKYSKICIKIYINKDVRSIVIPFYSCDYKSNYKTFQLTDLNYSGLKIEKGVLYLWPR